MEVEKSRPKPAENWGLYLEPGSPPLISFSSTHTHTHTCRLRSNAKARWHRQTTAATGSLVKKSGAGAGVLKDGPLSLCTLYSTCPPGLSSSPAPDSCLPLRVGPSRHFPHGVLSNYFSPWGFSPFSQSPSSGLHESLALIMKGYKLVSLRIRLCLSLNLHTDLCSCY